MVFSSAVFLLLFLPLVFVVNLILPKKCSNLFLLIASIFFYAWGEPVYVLLMLLTVTVNWIIGLCMEKYVNCKKIFLFVGVVTDIAIIGYFKYTNFLVRIINMILGNEAIKIRNIALPIGISFFIFQAISYIIDVYREDTKASSSIVNVALYISFFPQLIAGPIVKYKEINEQIENRTIDADGFSVGFRRFVYGLAKKVILANILGKTADLIFELPMDSVGFITAWIGAIVYSLQIYYDFSSYSDMAIGLGRMFGFSIPENFDYPYLAKSASEFWRRWHISLGTWFKEYVYFPLGGSRKGEFRTYINLCVVFFLSGLWHGASFSYIAWGMWYGFFSIMERIWLGVKIEKSKIWSRVYFLFIVCFGMIIFRINDLMKSSAWIVKMIEVWKINSVDTAWGYYMNNTTWVVTVAAFLGCGILQVAVPEKIRTKWKYSVAEWIWCAIILVLSIACIAGDAYNPFIYYNF